MKFNIRGSKDILDESVKNYIETKIGKLDKYFENPDEITANILVKESGIKETIEVTIPIKKAILRAEDSNKDIYAAIDLVLEKLERQIRKNKTKIKHKTNKENIDVFIDFEITEEEVNNNKIIKKTIEKLNEKKTKIKFIMQEDLVKFNSKNTLVAVLDTNKKSLLGYSKIVEDFDKIIVIDHHIKSDDQIENPIFSYIDNSKSSATEIMAAYLKSLNLKIEPIIATIMLAGIEVDTNEFNIKTSPETFKTAAYLLELGANNIDKQNLLKENKENYCKRQDFIKKSYMINKNMALCVMDKNIYERYQLALISEDLLQFDDVEASFTIGFIDKNIIGISARSIGEIDVEAIMRSLGGGGHQTDAACTIESKKLEEVKQKLLQSIEVIK